MNAVIFDLDGTMWDSRELIFAAWKQGLEGSTLPHVPLTPEFIHWCMGKTPEEIGAEAFPNVPHDVRMVEDVYKRQTYYTGFPRKKKAPNLFSCTFVRACRGRCRAQLFATKERYRCGLPLAGTHRSKGPLY